MTAVRLVVDTNVLVAAFRNRRGASSALLDVVSRPGARLLLSLALFLEYEEVMRRPDQLASFGLTPAEVDRALRDIAAIADPVEVHFRTRPFLVDPDDEIVLEAAVNGQADLLVTFNHKHFAAVRAQFGIEVVAPATALARILGHG